MLYSHLKYRLNIRPTAIVGALIVIANTCYADSQHQPTNQIDTYPAERIIIPIASQGDYLGTISTPAAREKQAAILQRYGQPNTQTAPTGSPPISRWDYADFSVYFEGDVVIHSVLKHRVMGM